MYNFILFKVQKSVSQFENKAANRCAVGIPVHVKFLTSKLMI